MTSPTWEDLRPYLPQHQSDHRHHHNGGTAVREMTDGNHVNRDNTDRHLRPDNKRHHHNQQKMRPGKDADTSLPDRRYYQLNLNDDLAPARGQNQRRAGRVRTTSIKMTGR